VKGSVPHKRWLVFQNLVGDGLALGFPDSCINPSIGGAGQLVKMRMDATSVPVAGSCLAHPAHKIRIRSPNTLLIDCPGIDPPKVFPFNW